MRYAFLIVASLVISLSGALTACSKPDGTVLVEIGKESITDNDLELLARVNPRLKGRLDSEVGRKQILENFVEQSLLHQGAKDRGLDADPLVREKIELYQKVILAQSLLEKKLEEATEAYFKDHPDEFEKVQLAHLYIPFKTEARNTAIDAKTKVKRTEEQAKKLAEKIKADLDKDPSRFAALVEKHSKDSRTNKRGGDLGATTRADPRLNRWGWSMIAEQAFALKKDDISGPIKSANGYHLIKLLQEKQADEFERVASRIRFKIQAQTKQDLITELKEKFPVEYAEVKQEEPVAVPPAGQPVPDKGGVKPAEQKQPAAATKPAAPPKQ